MHQVFLALGSNMGDRVATIHAAIDHLSEHLTDIQRAPIFETSAEGYEDQPDFLNTAISGYTSLAPEDLLVFVKQIETLLGRIERFRWGPREIDIDILLYDDVIIDTSELTIPHPRLHERRFVLEPLNHIGADFMHPRLDQSIQELFEKIILC